MNEEWLNNLRNKIDQHQEPAPEGLWEEIENELFSEEKKRFVFLKPEKQKDSKSVFAAYLKPALRVASVVLLTLISQEMVTHQIKTKDIEQLYTFENPELRPKISFKPSVSKLINETTLSENQGIAEPIQKEEKRLTVNLSLLENTISLKNQETEFISFDIKSIEQQNNRIAYQENNQLPAKKFTASILTGQVSSTSNQQHMGFTSMAAQPYENTSVIEGNTLTSIVARNSNDEVYTNIRHKSPFTAGISLQYHLSPKISIGSGLTYTKLVSELQAGSELDNIKSEQTLHYIGIPLQLNYQFFETSKLQLYLASGATFDKNIGGKLITQYTLDPVSENAPKEKLTDKTLQVSLNTMVGLQYKINSHLGIYLEPGLNYYFSNASQYSTLFKEKPLSINTKMGLRVTLKR